MQNADEPLGAGQEARLRLWPAGSPWIAPGTFAYPVRQRWFASYTLMANEPVFVDEATAPDATIYYHWGLDVGGAEPMVDVVAATDGLVVSAGGEYAQPGRVSADGQGPIRRVIYIRDARGWYYCYAHLKSIESACVWGRP